MWDGSKNLYLDVQCRRFCPAWLENTDKLVCVCGEVEKKLLDSDANEDLENELAQFNEKFGTNKILSNYVPVKDISILEFDTIKNRSCVHNTR